MKPISEGDLAEANAQLDSALTAAIDDRDSWRERALQAERDLSEWSVSSLTAGRDAALARVEELEHQTIQMAAAGMADFLEQKARIAELEAMLDTEHIDLSWSEKLRARIAELEETARDDINRELMGAVQADLEDARARIAELEGALREIADWGDEHEDFRGDCDYSEQFPLEHARAALAKGEKK